MSTSIREGFSAEETEHALGPDPFSPKRLRLLQALADAIFSEAPADPAARQENNELVASFAELFFPALPVEQARSQLALLVTTLLEEAAEAGFRPKDQALLSRDTSTEQPAASASGVDDRNNNLERTFTPKEEAWIAEGMRNSGKSRAEVIDEMLDFGIL